jgi:CBS-domain-containing membrane protein
VPAESSLLQAMDVFGKGVHRVAVMDNNGEMKGILTQSTVVNFLCTKVCF